MDEQSGKVEEMPQRAKEQMNESGLSKVRSTNVEKSSQRALEQEIEIRVCSNRAKEEHGKMKERPQRTLDQTIVK